MTAENASGNETPRRIAYGEKISLPPEVAEGVRDFKLAMAQPSEPLTEHKAWRYKRMPEPKPGNRRRHDQLYVACWNMAVERDFLVHGCENAYGCDGVGWVDLVICGHGHTVFVELKAEPFSRWESWQTSWKHNLIAAGIDYRIWYHYQWQSGEIERQFDELCNPSPLCVACKR